MQDKPSDSVKATDPEPIDPNSTRDRLRAWLHWMPMWMLVPLGLASGPGDTGHLPGDAPIGHAGPNDLPSHLDGGGFGGGGDMGGGFGGGF